MLAAAVRVAALGARLPALGWCCGRGRPNDGRLGMVLRSAFACASPGRGAARCVAGGYRLRYRGGNAPRLAARDRRRVKISQRRLFVKLYMHPVSTAARPVRLLIAENGIECEQDVVDILSG